MKKIVVRVSLIHPCKLMRGAAAFSALILASLLSCGVVAAQTLRVGLSSDVTSIDPQWNNSGPNVALALHIFEPLTATDKNG